MDIPKRWFLKLLKKKVIELVILEEVGSNQHKNYITLPHIPILSQNLRKKLNKYNIKIAF
jgi:hypothetical protein